MATHNELGNIGEQIASDFLKEKGYRIRAQKYRFQKMEIDIIAENEEFILFVEVKTRSDDRLSKPEDSVHSKKRKNIIETANHYLESHGIEKEARFDIVSIIIQGNKKSIRHIEDAFNAIN